MSPGTFGSTMEKIRDTLYSDFHKYGVTSSVEDEFFLATDNGNHSEDSFITKQNSRELRSISHSSKRHRSCIILVAILSFLLMAIFVLFVEAILVHNHQPINYIPAVTDNLKPEGWPLLEAGDTVIVDCGNSPEEAKSKGCVWDLMSYAWTHPACYNKNESEKFLAEYGPWKWYETIEDNKRGLEITNHEDLPYKPLVWTEEHYHISHCAYLLKLLHIAGMSGHLVTDEGIGMNHTDHCVGVFLDPERPDFKRIDTLVTLLFSKCVTVRDAN